MLAFGSASRLGLEIKTIRYNSEGVDFEGEDVVAIEAAVLDLDVLDTALRLGLRIVDPRRTRKARGAHFA
jgi:hypothetical protein